MKSFTIINKKISLAQRLKKKNIILISNKFTAKYLFMSLSVSLLDTRRKNMDIFLLLIIESYFFSLFLNLTKPEKEWIYLLDLLKKFNTNKNEKKLSFIFITIIFGNSVLLRKKISKKLILCSIFMPRQKMLNNCSHFHMH